MVEELQKHSLQAPENTNLATYLRGAAVYPGHAVVLAYIIMDEFPSYAAAMKKDKGVEYVNALTSDKVPGAGGCVQAALDLLREARLLSIEAAIFRADERWVSETSGGYLKYRELGQAQADGLKPHLIAKFANWPAE